MDSGSSSSGALVRSGVACLAFVGLLFAAAPTSAKVFFSQQEALELTFPDADRIESDTRVLSAEQVAAVEKQARSKLDTRIAKFYVGWKDDAVVGYAFIDVHTVRTLPEAFLVALDPDGSVTSMRVLAFHEPLDYLPTQRWYDQFQQRSLRDPLRLGRDIHGITGATLSARAVTDSVRRVLALYRIVVRGLPPLEVD